jgi:cleavage and polyadenylation specificity factor subunit 1
VVLIIKNSGELKTVLMSCVAYKELSPPTGIEECIYARFTGEYDTNIIVSKTSVLEIYTLTEPTQPTQRPLQLIAVYPLNGTISSMGVVKLPSKSRDCIILSFKDAKTTIIEWDLSRSTIGIVSMHYYENLPELKEV